MKVLPINRRMQDDDGIAQIRRATNIGRTEQRVSTRDVLPATIISVACCG